MDLKRSLSYTLVFVLIISLGLMVFVVGIHDRCAAYDGESIIALAYHHVDEVSLGNAVI